MAMTLGSAIRSARKGRGITLRKFAKEMEISAGLLSMIEQDAHVPPAELIAKCAKALQADADLWCGLAGKLTPTAEKSLARLARKDPLFFRRLIGK